MYFLDTGDTNEWPTLTANVVGSLAGNVIEVSIDVSKVATQMDNTLGYVVDWYKGSISESPRRSGRIEVTTSTFSV